MKILWFTNTPCLAAEKLNPGQVTGGWLSALNGQLAKEKNIKLSVCFYHSKKIKPFEHKNTTYLPVYRNNGNTLTSKIKQRIANKTNDKSEIPQLIEIINKVKPDIIHVHGTEENFGLIQPHTTIPVVISIQGILSPCFEKYYAGIPKPVVKKYEPLIDKVLFRSFIKNEIKLHFKALREQKILANAQHIIGRTDWDRRVTRVLAPKSHYYTVNEILRPEFYNNTWTKTQFGKPIKLLTTTSGGLYKGFETIVKTARILTQNKTLDFEWQVIGLAETNTIVKMVKRWLKVDFNQLNIKLLGRKKPDEMVDILLQSDIYCQVSHIENSPNSLCEAMLLGMPCIASIAGGTASLLTDKKEGLLIQDGDTYAYAGAIHELSKYPDIAQSVAQNAKAIATERHRAETISEKTIETYQNILNTNNYIKEKNLIS